MRLAEIHIYPLKSARGIPVERADVLAGGLRHDRRFLVVNAKGRFLTQRTHPRLTLVTTAFLARDAPSDTLELAVADLGAVSVPLAPEGPRRVVRIFGDKVEALDVGGAGVNELLTQHLGEPCSLVFMPDDVVRPVEAPYGAPGDRVGFADAYPVLLAARASLMDLNARLSEPVLMDRFRPNLVVEGGDAFEEERFGRVHVGSMSLRMPKRCARCAVTLVDQATAGVGKEPLHTLATYRSEDNNVHFAQNLIPEGEGTIAVGDVVRYTEPVQGR